MGFGLKSFNPAVQLLKTKRWSFPLIASLFEMGSSFSPAFSFHLIFRHS